MVKRAFPTKRKTAQLVNDYGYSLQSIKAMQNVTPFLSPRTIVEQWSRHLLKAESREEQRWLVMGVPLIENCFQKKVALWKPKALAYLLPGGRYTPDVLYILEDGQHVQVEVKGSQFQKGYKDARAKMRTAATLHWYHTFVMCMWERGAWQLEIVPPDPEYQTDLQTLAAEVQVMIDNQIIKGATSNEK